METIHAIPRGQEVWAKIQEEMNQRAHGAAANPTAIPMENHVTLHGNIPVQIPVGEHDSVPPSFLSPLIIEVGDQQDAIFSPRVASVYDAFGPSANEVGKKVRAIEEKLKVLV